VQIRTACIKPQEGSAIVPRRRFVAIRDDKPKSIENAQRREFKTCRYTAETIVADGEGKGTTQKVCTSPGCPVHHPKRQLAKADAAFKAQQEKQRREKAMAQPTEPRVLKAIGDAIPVLLMKRDLLFILEQLIARLDGRRQAIMDR
jgi:ParB family chromosome partitioning protein